MCPREMQHLAGAAHLGAITRRHDAQRRHQHVPGAEVLAAAGCCGASSLCSPAGGARHTCQLQLQLQRGAKPGRRQAGKTNPKHCTSQATASSVRKLHIHAAISRLKHSSRTTPGACRQQAAAAAHPCCSVLRLE